MFLFLFSCFTQGSGLVIKYVSEMAWQSLINATTDNLKSGLVPNIFIRFVKTCPPPLAVLTRPKTTRLTAIQSSV